MNTAAKNKPQGDINHLDESQFKWFAVYTKFKCEKYVAALLSRKKIEAYVPVMFKTKKYQRKVKKYEIPLINCYVFVKIKKSQYLPTMETEYVMKFLRQGKDLLSIPEHEIEILKRVSGDVEETFTVHDHDWIYGEEVEIMTGHLAGMRGKIISRTGKRSILIELETIGYQLRINMDSGLVRPVLNNKLIA